MSRKIDIRIGYLGWSNWRIGLEFYRLRDDENSRWKPREPVNRPPADNEQHGLLLQDDLERAGVGEGSTLIVISVADRDPEFIKKLCQKIVAEHAEATS